MPKFGALGVLLSALIVPPGLGGEYAARARANGVKPEHRSTKAKREAAARSRRRNRR